MGLDRSNPADRNGHDFSPIYTNLEVFLNGVEPVSLTSRENSGGGECLFDVAGRRLSSDSGTGICISSSGSGFRASIRWSHR